MKRIIAFAVIPFVFAFIVADTFLLKGKITDESGKPVSAASVIVKGTSKGTISDALGLFELKDIKGNEKLIISALGYETKEINIRGRKQVDIVLKTSNLLLEEVVVAGISTSSQGRKQVGASAPVNAQSKMFYTEDYDKEFHRPYYPQKRSDREGYEYTPENEFMKVNDNPLSTFSIDVDAASYANVRRMLKQGYLPPAGAVRIEEMVNYFSYDYKQPGNEHPFEVFTEMNACPWNSKHKLLMIGLQGKKIAADNLPASNLVFLIDVSGSMMSPEKLPLVKESMKMLTDQLREQDKVSIVVYAGNAGLVLPPTSGIDKQKIKSAIDGLEAGGSTAGGAGIKLAYATAAENLVNNGNNRVILCTDGDFNVGASSDDELVRMIEEKRNSGIFLTVLGYGMGNYQDAKMQKLADKGNGNHHYIDELKEAKKVLVNEFGGTLFTIAKDVKLQVEFNPALVQGYRLIGYENRMLAKEDFNDDKKDAGEMGSGHTVTALYEIIPADTDAPELRNVDPLKYQKQKSKTDSRSEWANIKLRYKEPEKDNSVKFEVAVKSNSMEVTPNFRLAAAVAEFGMLLKNSKFKGEAAYSRLLERTQELSKADVNGYKQEMIELIKAAQSISDKALVNRYEK